MPLIDITLSELLAIGFATYIITDYFVYQHGAFGMFANFRKVAGINVAVMDIEGNQTGEYISNGSFLAELLSCHKCTSFWVGLLMIIVHIFVPLLVTSIGAIGLAGFLLDLNYEH